MNFPKTEFGRRAWLKTLWALSVMAIMPFALLRSSGTRTESGAKSDPAEDDLFVVNGWVVKRSDLPEGRSRP